MAFYRQHIARRYGRCCMYGPNNVKLSRVFAVQLFSMLIGHYVAPPPVRSDPHWPHSHASPPPFASPLSIHCNTHLPATQTSAVVTKTCPDYLHPHIPERCTHPRPCRYTSTPAPNGYWVWHALAPRCSQQDTAAPPARDSNLDSCNQDMSRLSTLAYPDDAPIHGLADIPLRLLPTDIGCGTLAPRSRQHTATCTARDSNLENGNHEHSMSRLSALAYPNDAPIHGLTDIRLA
jgi:hypothetical protein